MIRIDNPIDLSDYLRLDGTNVPTADFSWTTDLTTTGKGTFGDLVVDNLSIDGNTITSVNTHNFALPNSTVILSENSVSGGAFYVPEISFSGVTTLGSIKDFLYIRSSGGSTPGLLFSNSTLTSFGSISYDLALLNFTFSHSVALNGDNRRLMFGTGYDASIYYNNTDLIIDPKVVGSGKVNLNGGNLYTTGTLESSGFIISNADADPYIRFYDGASYGQLYYSKTTDYFVLGNTLEIGTLLLPGEGSGSPYLYFRNTNNYLANTTNMQLVSSSSLDISANDNINIFSVSGYIYLDTTDITTTGLGTFGNLDVDTLNFNGNSITDSTGTINFGNEHLITSGNITAEKIYLNYYGDASITHDTIDLIIKSEIGTSAYVDFTNFGLYRFDNDIETSGTITSGRLAHDASTYIDKDGSNNMTFTDAVTGTLTLAELGRATMIDVSDTSVAEGNNSVVIGYDKANLKWLKIATTSTDWTLTIYSSDDYASEPMEIVTNRSGDFNVYLDMPYEDDDATGELHYNFTSASGSETHDIQILGEALR